MAFFAAFGSSIGKKLLLFGLRQIDILDKDPADFVSVDVGKNTTLEVRDVGLHVKKLVALLHLKLPPEIHLSKARASLFRVTVVFEFGVPKIIIEVDGVQIHARLAEHEESRSRKQDASPVHRRSPSPAGSDDTSSDSDIPSIDHLAHSFIREEPEEEIRELEEALHAQSESLQASIASSAASSDDGEDEASAGMGAPLGLPGVLRNLLNTALDRLQIVVKDIDIEVEDQLPSEASDANQEQDEASVCLNFHVDRITMDSVTSQDAKVDITSASTTTSETLADRGGKRRMRVENICARLISDAEHFASMSPSMSRASQPSSPIDTRSVASSSQKSRSEASASQAASVADLEPESVVEEPSSALSVSQASASNSVQELVADSIYDTGAQIVPEAPSVPEHHSTDALVSSVHTADEDRFADAESDDGLDRSFTSNYSEPHHTPHHPDMGASSLLYDDEGMLDYTLQNNLLTSQSIESPSASRLLESQVMDNEATPDFTARAPSLPTQKHAPYVSSPLIPHGSSRSVDTIQPLSQSMPSQLPQVTDNLVSARHQVAEGHTKEPEEAPLTTSPPSDEDLTESKIFTHDEAESMYLSAVSGGPGGSSFRGPVPGGWESSSGSSKSARSDIAVPVPDAMLAGSILEPPSEADGCDTPRPGSPQSIIHFPRGSYGKHHSRTSTDGAGNLSKLVKTFLTIDQVTVWFPLGLGEQETPIQHGDEPVEQPELMFSPPNLAQDSIFQDMPGSFSNYALSSASRRKDSLDTPSAPKYRPNFKSAAKDTPNQGPKKDASATISVDVGYVIGHIDFSTGRIMFQLLDRAIKAIAGEPTSNQEPSKGKPEPPSSSRHSLELSVKNVGIAWLERLTTDSLVLGHGESRPLLDLNPSHAIFRIRLAAIQAMIQNTSEGSRSKIQIGKFTLSSLDHDIISFLPPRPRSKRSISNSIDIMPNDVEIDFEQGSDSRITVVTRPVKVTFDLEKLDEALSSFGGFSGILELGNSISSSISANSPIASVAPTKPRGVHFGDVPAAPKPVVTSSRMPKIQVQLGEVSFVLKGKSCAVRLQTTSVRIAVRESNVRVKISEVILTGPYVDAAAPAAPLIVEVKGTTVNFLNAPEEVDLTKLISMITPSKDPYENDEDILVDTLLRQRRKGSVLRVEVADVVVRLSDLAHLQTFEVLGAELVKFSKVAKYLPDDDRPGILTLAMVQHFDALITVNENLGAVSMALHDVSLAHVGVPSLLAAEVGKVALNRGEERLVHEVVQLRTHDNLPMIMVRIVGDEMEPVVKAKLFNVCTEYHVSTLMAALSLPEEGTADDLAVGLASSVATITGGTSPHTLSRQTSDTTNFSTASPKPLHIDLLLRSCALGLNPRNISSKALFVLTDARFLGKQSKKEGYSISVELRKASIHAIDDVGRFVDRETPVSPAHGLSAGTRQLMELREQGYVSLSSIAGAQVSVNITGDGNDQQQSVAVEFKNELFVLESCADSTQTLIGILNGLQPPRPPSTAQKYRTVVSLQEMMESFTGDAMAAPEQDEDENFMENADLVADEVPTNLEFVGSMYNSGSLPTGEDFGDSMLGEEDLGALAPPPAIRQRGDRRLLESFQEQYEIAEGEPDFDLADNYFQDSDSEHKGKARKWDSKKNRYHLQNEFKTANAPLVVRVRDVNIIWNLYDGYDWPRTREIFAQAVEDVEARAEERRQRPRDDEDDDDFVEQDFLFNSVWIGVPVKDEKGALTRRINHDIDDLVSETGSYATSTATRSTGATARPRSGTNRRKLKLGRSKNKKIAFDLSGIATDLIVFPTDSGETQNSLNVRVHNLTIYDHVPTSTWNKFVTSLIEPSKREMDKPMIDLEILTVKPITDLAASELVIGVKVLPLRLHVDQDSLDFITRFFEFKDDSASSNDAPSEQPFIQRLEVMAVKLKLDYKPKRVDYRGLRSGHTTELMNFVILDSADILLRHAIVYGLTSFDKIHKTLNDVWMPDVRTNQLPTVLSGIAAVRPLVNVGMGVRDLVVVPMREYKKDGRIVRSLQKGVYAFAKTTTSEVARLGAKVAIGTQTLLEGAENFLNPQASSPPGRSNSSALSNDWEDFESADADESEQQRARSHYANQPIGVKAGLRSAARHLERDLLTARDAVIAIPTEIMEEGTGVGMARAIARRAPTVILRPALGATKAVSNALLGVGNALDGDSRRKIDDKYKSY